MAKSKNEVYDPGELDRVRKNLRVTDQDEAKRMSERLGGEIGYERKAAPEPPPKTGGGKPKTPGRRLELADDSVQDDRIVPVRNSKLDPSDDPAVPLRYSYIERLRMDRFAAQGEFEIKSHGQVLQTMVSFFNEAPDLLNPYFVTKRMQEYYKKIETVVTSTRNLFPRNNLRRNERLKKSAPVAYAILDTIRHWNIEKISGDLARHQAHPRNVKVKDFIDIIKAIYRPLYILEKMDMEAHIRTTYKILYKLLCAESPREAPAKFQPMVRAALSAYSDVKREIRYLLYPLLLKLVSSVWLPYDSLFIARKNRILALIGVKESEQINPLQISDIQESKEGEDEEAGDPEEEAKEEKKEELSEEEKTQRSAAEFEQKALERGLKALEVLFPRAGWEKLSDYPDLYPYFVDVLDLRKGIVNIAPTDPLHQVIIMMRIIEELFYGLRHVSFGTIHTAAGSPERISEGLMDIISNWHYFVQLSFEKEYLPNLTEYVRILEGSPEERSSQYARKIITDMHWMKRLYYLPYYKFETVAAPSFQKKDVTAIYTEIKSLRRYLTAVAAGIDQGNKSGGAAANVPCDGIDNPWDAYNFQVPNPVSKRLDALLAGKKKTNAILVYFSLAATVVLDHLVNNENSWAYNPKSSLLFRSIDGKGLQPLTGVDKKIDADQLFRDSLKGKEAEG